MSGPTQSTPFVHRFFDFHGGPPLLELGALYEMQRKTPVPFNYTTDRILWHEGLKGPRCQGWSGSAKLAIPWSKGD